MLQPTHLLCLEIMVYIFADPSEVVSYFVVGYSKDTKSVFFKSFCSDSVFFRVLGLKMLTSVKPGFGAVEICNVISENFLSVKTRFVVTKKVIPKMTLLFGHVFTKFFCIWGVERIVLSFHNFSLRKQPLRPLRGHLPLHRGGFKPGNPPGSLLAAQPLRSEAIKILSYCFWSRL